jgi:zinc-ribbon domain
MFCPGCATQISDDTRFCRSCGANLRGVREAMTGRNEQFDWSKTWVAEMFMSEEERERRRGVTPEHKRINEIKAGVITTLAGLGAMIFLRFFLEAVANNEPGGEAEIIRRVWLVGLVPFFIGIGLLINGFFLSKRQVKLQTEPPMPLPPRPTNQLAEPSRSDFSVAEHTTAHLPERQPVLRNPNE